MVSWLGVCACCALGASLSAQAVAIPTAVLSRLSFIAPDDPRLSYSEFVTAQIDVSRARFERPTVASPASVYSPGTRIAFATDATRIRVSLDYQSTKPFPGSGLFLVEIDGVLSPQFLGSDSDLGAHVYELPPQASWSGRREFQLLLPYASDVDFLGLELSGGAPGLLPAPPPRPPFLWVPYGDSITQGRKGSSTAGGYTYQVGGLSNWSVINMGFASQKVTAADGLAVGSLDPDRVTVAIGINDHSGATSRIDFLSRYGDFLDNLRALAPSTPVFAITPTWVSYEGSANGAGLTVEDYRQLIRTVVLPRTVNDAQLYLIEGLLLVPPGSGFFPDGVHPNDSGFVHYATHLGGANLVAEPGFEFAGYAWVDTGNSVVQGSAAHSGAAGLMVGPGPGGRKQSVGRVERGLDYQLSAWAHVGSPGQQGGLGLSFLDENGVELSQVSVQITTLGSQLHVVAISAPVWFASVELRCATTDPTSTLIIDDISLIASAAPAGLGAHDDRGL